MPRKPSANHINTRQQRVHATQFIPCPWKPSQLPNIGRHSPQNNCSEAAQSQGTGLALMRHVAARGVRMEIDI